jgi:hypothetical protein
VDSVEVKQRMLKFSDSLAKSELCDAQGVENGSITRYIHIKHADSTVKIFRETTV